MRSDSGLNVTGGEEPEGEVTHFLTFPSLQRLYAELEAVRVYSVSKQGNQEEIQIGDRQLTNDFFSLLLIFVFAVF